MKKTLITAATLACAAMQLSAQNFKEGVITFSMNEYYQNSVSTSKVTANAGDWTGNPTGGPAYYKTASARLTTANILRSIAYVIHGKNANYYTSKAELVLVQGELGGFFNMTDPGLPEATAVLDEQGLFSATSFGITTVDQGATFAALATGRHLLPNPSTLTTANTTGQWPPGHHQPWGQIFVKDPGKSGFSATDPLCENVTFFFAITVEECYDCFYLSSFITDTSFTSKANSSSGPPCCTVPNSLLGSGKDRYYMSLSFDNTSNNPYLNPESAGSYVGWGTSTADNYYYAVKGIDLLPPALPADGIRPDLLPYDDIIRSGLGTASPYEMRFTLQGIMTYSWNLKFINTGDAFADFVGTAGYAARGFGFIGLFCALLDGGVLNAMAINEGIKKADTCCQDDPWYDSWYGIGWNQPQDPWDTFGTNLGLSVAGFGSPINTQSDLSFHTSFDQDYYPGWEWGTNPTYDELEATPLDLDHPETFVPIWSAPVAGTNSVPLE